ncbi:1,2-phenylacetyl-CoA epoxidase subunit PaaD [Alicyclobacillus pomorum]|jgi:ring-1,2-phenylacetyl-CoA epoxidase subunit PaaD|uniref:1,2-phenylacetyl-CoA epoxidase subunit PaaD n=1 Tax=Alicyclobacillus pomorum TaxID=204470 RepID=UPI00041C04F3|nr:1,2-phenylacetyl-CoA epoxidase subunit PaaD [Alicyclobacillus pomorum]
MATEEQDVTTRDLELESAVRDALQTVYDPELPTLTVLDLGMVRDVRCQDGTVEVSMMPTFVGCPAIPMLRKNVEQALMQVPGVERVSVQFVFDETWTTERISEEGKRKLQAFGIAPPACSLLQMKQLTADCPYCGSNNTRLDNLFGPTACRSVFFCNHCKQPFEAMKPV